mgnify:CR=1 FL=1
MFTFTSQKHLSCLPFVNKLQKIEYAAKKCIFLVTKWEKCLYRKTNACIGRLVKHFTTFFSRGISRVLLILGGLYNMLIGFKHWWVMLTMMMRTLMMTMMIMLVLMIMMMYMTTKMSRYDV